MIYMMTLILTLPLYLRKIMKIDVKGYNMLRTRQNRISNHSLGRIYKFLDKSLQGMYFIQVTPFGFEKSVLH